MIHLNIVCENTVNGVVLEKVGVCRHTTEELRKKGREEENSLFGAGMHPVSFSNKGDTNELIMRKGARFQSGAPVQPPRKRTLRVSSRQSGSSAVPAAIKIKERRTDQTDVNAPRSIAAL